MSEDRTDEAIVHRAARLGYDPARVSAALGLSTGRQAGTPADDSPVIDDPNRSPGEAPPAAEASPDRGVAG